ncbi:MAG: indolepyruvate oxidoreductase subunit beta [Mogibacterium sp.]|nr:indolepyruvate oxidoreductase subunit beta [Mogibacterium sp.]
MSKVTSILLSGVGGQGAVLISKILTNGFVGAGYDVKQSENHGMSQRGGCVTTQVRFGDKVYGPLFGKGQADIMIALERMEAVRCADMLKPDAVVIVNDYRQDSSLTASGLAEYPEGCVEAMQENFNTVVLNAEEIATSLGNIRCANVVLLGAACAACKELNQSGIDWESVIAATVPPKHKELNIQAFRAGMAAAAQ